MDEKFQELKASVLEWRAKIGKQENAEFYYAQNRSWLMNETLPDKNLIIIPFRLIDKTKQGETIEHKDTVKLYDVAMFDGFIPREMVENCLTATKEDGFSKAAIVPAGTLCWDDTELEWKPVEKSEIAEFCL